MITPASTGSNPIFLDNLGCDSSDVDLLMCDRLSSSLSIGVHSCSHLLDVGVKCTGKRRDDNL